MAKRPSLISLVTGFFSGATLNSNFESLQAGFDNTLSLDGSTPNAMNADLDMNENDILNAGVIHAQEVVISGVSEESEGGDSLYNRVYDTTDDFIVAVKGGGLDDGTRAYVKDKDTVYVTDDTVAFGDCILRDYGVDGVRAETPVNNSFLGCFFHGRHKGSTVFNTSYDGVNFSGLNWEALPATGTGNDTLGGRDPSVVPYRGKWYTLYTGSDEATHDFRMGVSEDMLTWTEHYISLGSTIKTSSTTPMAGGTVPAINIWAPEVVYNPTDKDLYVVLNVVYDDDLTDDYGNTIYNRRPFYSTFDPETRTVGEPVSIDMGGAEATVSYIGHAFYTDSDNLLWMAIKNDVTKKMEIWGSSGGIAGTFTKVWTSTSDLSQEGYSWVKVFEKNPDTGNISHTLRIYIDKNRNGPNEAYPNEFAEVPYYIEGATPASMGNDMNRAYMDTPCRHGTVINMGHNVDPYFLKHTDGLRSLFGTNPRDTMAHEEDLGSPAAVAIRPRNDFLYYIDGINNSVDLTIMDGSADRFWLQARGGFEETGFNIIYEDGISQTDDNVYKSGFGSQTAVEWRRAEGGNYYPTSNGYLEVATTEEIRAGGNGPNNKAITPARMRNVPRHTGAVVNSDKVWYFNQATEETLWLNLDDLPSSGGGSGFNNWSENGTALEPATDGQVFGDATNRIREIIMQPRANAGTAGTNLKTTLFVAQDGSLRMTDDGVTGSNAGADVGQFHHMRDVTGHISGTHTWDKHLGQGINFTSALTGPLTVDLSTSGDNSFKVGEKIRIRVANPGSNSVNFTLPSGTLEWAGGTAYNTNTSTVYYDLHRIGASNVYIQATEA